MSRIQRTTPSSAQSGAREAGPARAEHAGDVAANQFAVLGMDHVDPQTGIGRVFVRRVAGRGQTALAVLRGQRQPVSDLYGVAIAGDGCQQLQIPLLAAG